MKPNTPSPTAPLGALPRSAGPSPAGAGRAVAPPSGRRLPTSRRVARREDRGAVLVEFAFAFPVLLVLVLGALGACYAGYLQVSAEEAARAGARYASIALPPDYHTHPSPAAVAAAVAARVPALKLTAADVTVTYAGCPAPCTSPPPNTPLTVTINKPMAIPFVEVGTWTITATAGGEVRAE